jgi:excisionase family DNA binding protein
VQCPYCGSETTWLLPQQVAQLMNVPVQTVRRWLRENRFPGARVADVRGRKVWQIPTETVLTIMGGKA